MTSGECTYIHYPYLYFVPYVEYSRQGRVQGGGAWGGRAPQTWKRALSKMINRSLSLQSLLAIVVIIDNNTSYKRYSSAKLYKIRNLKKQIYYII